MRSFYRFSILASVLVLPAVLLSCSDDDDPVGPGDDVGAVSGEVQDEEGSGISGVGVTLASAAGDDRSTSSAGDGSFTFGDLEPGTWSLSVDAPAGYEVVDAPGSVGVSAGETAEVTIVLGVDDDAEDVQEIVLQGDLTFSPDEVTIEPGTTVRWVSDDTMFHTVTPDGHDEWAEANFNEPGDTFEHTFEDEGQFDYYCAPHVDQGMTGTIHVEADDEAGEGDEDDDEEDDDEEDDDDDETDY